MKELASFVFQTMMFPHNGKIITIDQVSHYDPNPSSNIDNILPFSHTNPNAYPLIDMGRIIFKDPSLLGTYHGALLLIHPSTKFCVISSNGTETWDTLPPIEASLLSDVPLIANILPQESPKNLHLHLFPISHSPRATTSLGDSPPSHYSNALLLPPIRHTIFPGIRALMCLNHSIACTLGAHPHKILLCGHLYSPAQKQNPNYYAGGYEH